MAQDKQQPSSEASDLPEMQRSSTASAPAEAAQPRLPAEPGALIREEEAAPPPAPADPVTRLAAATEQVPLATLGWTAAALAAIFVVLVVLIVNRPQQAAAPVPVTATGLPFRAGPDAPPLPFAPQQADEVLIIVANFEGDDETGYADQFADALRGSLGRTRFGPEDEIGVRIERLSSASLDNPAGLDLLQPTIVVRGSVEDRLVLPRFEFDPNLATTSPARADLGLPASALPRFGPAISPFAENQLTYLNLISQGQIAYAAQDYPAALDYFEQAAKVDLRSRPRSFDADVLYQYLALTRYNTASALPEVVETLLLAMLNNPQELLAAFAYRAPDDLSGALARLDAEIEAEPDDASLLSQRALAYLGQGAPQLALEDAQAALEANPQRIEAHVYAGMAHLMLGSPDRAASAFAQALETDPAYLPALRGLVLTQAVLGLDGDALEGYRQVIEAGQPVHYTLILGQALALDRLGATDEAIGAYNTFLDFYAGGDAAVIGLVRLRIDQLELEGPPS